MMDGMSLYVVRVYENKDDPTPIKFICWAEDEKHSVEQAENAYPLGRVAYAVLKKDQDDAYTDRE